MSEPGSGYFKFRCKNFFTYNCPNWVWVSGTPCAACVAAGREAIQADIKNHNFVNHVLAGIRYDEPFPEVSEGPSPSRLDTPYGLISPNVHASNNDNSTDHEDYASAYALEF